MYICSIDNNLKKEIMKAQELKIAKALLTAKEILTQMISQGFGEVKYVFALSNMIAEEFNLTKDEAIIVIEESLKLKNK